MSASPSARRCGSSTTRSPPATTQSASRRSVAPPRGSTREHRPDRATSRAPRRAARHPTPAPRLSWRLPDGARVQHAYRITADNGWDTGWVDERPEPAGAVRGPALALVAAGASGRSRCGPTSGESPWSEPAWFETGLLWTDDWRRAGSSRADARPGRRASGRRALLRFEFDVDRPVVARPAARHRARHLRGVPQRRTGRRRRADAGLHPVRRARCRCRPTTSPPCCGRPERARRRARRRLVPRPDRHRPRRRPVGQPARAARPAAARARTTAA